MNEIITLIEKKGCDHTAVSHFLDWSLEYPGKISYLIQKYALKSITGMGEGLPTEELTLHPTDIVELNFLEYTAGLLYEIAEKKN